MSSWKGKEKAVPGKDDKTGGRKRKDRDVLRFLDDIAFELNESDDSSDDDYDIDDFLDDDIDNEVNSNKEPAKAPPIPFIKEEEMNEEELERMVNERYGPGSNFVTYAEDGGLEGKRLSDRVENSSSSRDPTLWKVKCVVGRERHSAFCLMQKFVDLRSLGLKFQIISAFTHDHVKGFIYIEADKQNDVYEACKGLTNIYTSRVAPVSQSEISHVLSVRTKSHGITEGMWARVKNGKYKGDLAQVAAINDARKKVTVKLIPRIDLRALADKFGGGVSVRKAPTPAPRLISAGELEEFRPLIQVRRDRDTNKVFQVLDGMMLKDGYLYKKVSIDSLSLWGAVPTEDELLKFEPPNHDESNDLEWLSDLYGDRKKKRIETTDKVVSGKGKGSSSSTMEKGSSSSTKEKGGSSSSNIDSEFEVHDLVFFGRKDFGVIIGMEKDDFMIMKELSEVPLVVTLPSHDLKRAIFDKKLFTALDQHMKAISINDTVRILDGPLKDREGTVKRIYKGIVFIYNEMEEENHGYTCIKSQKCEKVIVPGTESIEKDNEQGASGFGDFTSSPKSPLSPKKSFQGRENKGNFNREDKDGMFSVGQSLRIRVGPLKGYLCRVLAIRRTDITVKLDSQQKILTVKMEHLAEVRAKSSPATLGEDQSVKPFELLGTAGGSDDWMAGAGTGTTTAVESGGWNVGGSSTTEGSGWGAASKNSDQPSSGAVVEGESGWAIKPPAAASSQSSGWGAAATGGAVVVASESVEGDSWNKAVVVATSGGNSTDSWGKAVETRIENSSGQGSSWGKKDDDSSLNKVAAAEQTGAWGSSSNSNSNAAGQSEATDSWGSKKNDSAAGGGWGSKAVATQDSTPDESSWGKPAAAAVGGGGRSSWGQKSDADVPKEQGSSWGKPPKSPAKPDAGGSSWGAQKTQSPQNDTWGAKKTEPAGGSWGGGQKTEVNADAQEGGSSSAWSKPAGGGSGGGSTWGAQKTQPPQNDSWGGGSSSKPAEGGSSWGQKTESNTDGGSSWNSSKPSAGGTNDEASGWGAKKTSEGGGGGGGWGGGNQNSSWSSKGNWSSGDNNDGGGSQDQSDNSYRGRGRGGGGWRGRGGRGGDSDDGGGGGGWRGRGGRGGDSDGGGGGWRGRGGRGGRGDSDGGGGGGWRGGGGGDSEGGGGGWRGGRGDSGGGGGWRGGGGGDSEGGGGGGWRGGGRGGRGGDSDGGGGGGWRGGGGDSEGGGGWRGGRGDSEGGGGWRGGGRGGDRGGGGYRGRGGFGGRGRGRNDQSGDDNGPPSWSKSNNGGDGGGGGGSSWSSGGGGGGGSWGSGGGGGGSWGSGGGGGNNGNKGSSWNEGGGDGGKWKSGGNESGGNAQSGGGWGGASSSGGGGGNNAGSWGGTSGGGGGGNNAGSWGAPSGGSDGGNSKGGGW